MGAWVGGVGWKGLHPKAACACSWAWSWLLPAHIRQGRSSSTLLQLGTAGDAAAHTLHTILSTETPRSTWPQLGHSPGPNPATAAAWLGAHPLRTAEQADRGPAASALHCDKQLLSLMTTACQGRPAAGKPALMPALLLLLLANTPTAPTHPLPPSSNPQSPAAQAHPAGAPAGRMPTGSWRRRAAGSQWLQPERGGWVGDKKGSNGAKRKQLSCTPT